MCVDVVVIGVVFGSELGGECRALGDLDLDREGGSKMESWVVDRESVWPWKWNGKEWERVCETGWEVGELANEVLVDEGVVLDSAVWGMLAVVVIGWMEVALAEEEGEAAAFFLPLVYWSEVLVGLRLKAPKLQRKTSTTG
jgi:hypothetical protein